MARRVGGGKGWEWVVCALAPMAQADALDQPLALGDRAPLAQIHGLPAPRAGAVLAPGQTETRLTYDIANNFVEMANGGEALVFDGETQRLELAWRAGLGDRWEAGFTVPYIQQRGGNLDSFIEGWHDFFGLPDGGRPAVARNRLDYHYERGSSPATRRVELNIDSPQSGIGDVRLDAAYQLWQTGATQVVLAATVKLSTGDADRLTGDGTTTTDLTLAASTQNLWGSTLSGYANAGLLWLPDGDVLADIQRNTIWHAAAGLSWPAYDFLALKIQLDLHQAFYRSDLRALGTDSVLLVLGGTARLAPHWLLDIGVGEDLHVDTAPDVTLQIGLRWAP